MRSIDGYIVRTTLGAFVMVLVSLTGVIWITQALRFIDLMTNQGQTILVFLGFTGLAIPSLVLVIAPMALVIAVAYVLNKLSTDSEIIVMNAAGLRPWLLFRPFLAVTGLVSLLLAFDASYLAPEGLRRLKQWDAEITADVVNNVLQTGRFMKLDVALTIFFRERQPGGRLVGVFIDDKRDVNERVSIVADHGDVVKNDDGSFLILEDGTLQRFEAGKREPAIVLFERYAFDMSKVTDRSKSVIYSARERYVWQLLSPDPNDLVFMVNPRQFSAEMHERIFTMLYPLAFVALAFAFLGAPRTTRQSRAFSVSVTAAAVIGLRLAGFACSVLAQSTAAASYVQYALIASTIATSAVMIRNVTVIEPPAKLSEALSQWLDRFTDRLVPT
jgi:lipopolysaccharide export system permease protein